MNRAFSIFLTIALVFCLCACTEDYSTVSNNIAKKSTSAISTPTTVKNDLETQSNTAVTETKHIHSWKDATCSTPKTCSICGDTAGSPADHSWEAATCTAPKTCAICKKTTGSTIAHDYVNGTCKVCGKEDPSDPKNITVWIPTNGGTKYHTNSGCSNMLNPEQTTLDRAIQLGFEVCKRCH